jgi:hypothetical protein
MIHLTVKNGDGALNDLDMDKVREADEIEVLVLDQGLTSGRPSITLHFVVGEEHFIAQTSARLFCLAARIVTTQYPKLFEGE